MKVLGLFGSPRRGGNTDLLLEEFLKGAAHTGAEIEKIYISNLKITPCEEHMDCLQTGECIIKDDMQAIYPSLLNADIVILAAPIFFYHLPAQTKALIDRCQTLWAKKYILKLPPRTQTNHHAPRQGFFISTAGTKGAKLFDGAILTVKYFFDVIGVNYSGELTYRQIDTKGAIKQHPTALTDIANKAKELIEN